MTITGRTRVFALLGDPVAHSVSPRMQNAAFTVLGLDAVYVALRVTEARVEHAMRLLTDSGGGGNVTLPHKEAAARAVGRIVEGRRASPAGGAPLPACNTFWGEGGALLGANTDVAGILAGLDQLAAPATAWLVIGTGGSSRAALEAARQRGARVAVRSRSPERAAAFLARVGETGVDAAAPSECEVVINATPLGLRADDPLPMEPADGATVRYALDLVYASGETRWVVALRARGITAADGREVLVAQGAASLAYWFPGVHAPLDVMRAAVRAALGS